MSSTPFVGASMLHVTFWLAGLSSALVHGQEHRPQSMNLRPLDGLESLESFRPDSKFRIAARAVGMIMVRLSTGDTVTCTGVIVSADLVLTAKHCLEYEDPETGVIEQLFPQRITFILDYISFGSSSGQIEVKSEPLERGEAIDYMLLELSKPISTRGRTILGIGRDPTDNEDLLVIHHPSAQPLKLTRFSCRAAAKAVDGDYFNHTCGTQQSSSGAPVFDSEFNLVGIHVRGGLSPIPGTFNRGVLLSRVLEVSPTTKAALKPGAAAILPTTERSNQRASVLNYNVGNAVFRRTESGWSFSSKIAGEAVSKPLILQVSSDPSQVLLWSPSDDTLYQLPLAGGKVLMQSAGERGWVSIGIAVKGQ